MKKLINKFTRVFPSSSDVSTETLKIPSKIAQLSRLRHKLISSSTTTDSRKIKDNTNFGKGYHISEILLRYLKRGKVDVTSPVTAETLT